MKDALTPVRLLRANSLRIPWEFRAWWTEHEIVLDCGSLYEINHPLVGRLALHPTVFPMPEQPDLQMIVYTPLAQEDTAAKLRALRSWKKPVASYGIL